MWKATSYLGQGQPDALQGSIGKVVFLVRRSGVLEAMGRGEQIFIDPRQWVEGVKRVLKNRLELGNKGLAIPTASQRGDVHALESQFAAAGHLGAQDHIGNGRLTAARLADHGENLRFVGPQRK